MSEKLIEERIDELLELRPGLYRKHPWSREDALLREAAEELRRLRAELKKFAGTVGTTDWWCDQW